MFAAVDAGSNTLRLLVGEVVNGKVVPHSYLRRICRLAGGFSQQEGLSPAARERTLFAFRELSETCQRLEIRQVRAVGTAAFRQAVNGNAFADEIEKETGTPLEIISGEVEAALMADGVLSVLEPMPTDALIVDIGGGSTEFVLCSKQKVLWSCSLPLGVVRLTEGHTVSDRQSVIRTVIEELHADLVDVCTKEGLDLRTLTLVGTAGTVTTLAALDMQMTTYDWRLVNNYSLSLDSLQSWHAMLTPLSACEREDLPGMEAGRGDLIVSGLEIILCLMRRMNIVALTVSDFGILEGLLLSLQNSDGT